MTAMAAACGILIVVLGVWSTGHAPTEAQSLVEIVCLIGGLILCFIAVILARLGALATRLDAFDATTEPADGAGAVATKSAGPSSP